MVDDCYQEAGVKEEAAMTCDLFERDVLDLLWGGLDFVSILTTNKDKYMLEYGSMSQELFEQLIETLTGFSEEFFELLDEVDNHKEVTLLRIKTLIDDRTQILVQEMQNDPTSASPGIVTTQIDVTTAEEPTSEVEIPELSDLPETQIENAPDVLGTTEGELSENDIEALEEPERKLRLAKRTKYLTRNGRKLNPRMFVKKIYPHTNRKLLQIHRR